MKLSSSLGFCITYRLKATVIIMIPSVRVSCIVQSTIYCLSLSIETQRYTEKLIVKILWHSLRACVPKVVNGIPKELMKRFYTEIDTRAYLFR
jgi:hypothetical protein